MLPEGFYGQRPRKESVLERAQREDRTGAMRIAVGGGGRGVGGRTMCS